MFRYNIALARPNVRFSFDFNEIMFVFLLKNSRNRCKNPIKERHVQIKCLSLRCPAGEIAGFSRKAFQLSSQGTKSPKSQPEGWKDMTLIRFCVCTYGNAAVSAYQDGVGALFPFIIR